MLDLDNTLWSGVAGEDEITTRNEELVKYAQELQTSGVILTVCSRNDEEIAREVYNRLIPFLASLFIVSWDDKVTSLRRTARELNIGLDSLVFIDDNPRERELVKRYLPEVEVVANVRELKEGDYFVKELTREDRQRAKFYSQMIEGKKEQDKFEDMEEFLDSLNLKYEIHAPYEEESTRVDQLLRKANQFNMTKVPYLAEKAIVVKLKDRLGEYGLISVLTYKIEDSILTIINGDMVNLIKRKL